jgi:hypothetical protein
MININIIYNIFKQIRQTLNSHLGFRGSSIHTEGTIFFWIVFLFEKDLKEKEEAGK